MSDSGCVVQTPVFTISFRRQNRSSAFGTKLSTAIALANLGQANSSPQPRRQFSIGSEAASDDTNGRFSHWSPQLRHQSEPAAKTEKAARQRSSQRDIVDTTHLYIYYSRYLYHHELHILSLPISLHDRKATAKEQTPILLLFSPLFVFFFFLPSFFSLIRLFFLQQQLAGVDGPHLNPRGRPIVILPKKLR